MKSGAEEPKSPCISVCALDDDDVCMGCYRNAQEITDWVMCSAEEKREILEKARQRFEQANPIRLG